MTNKQKLGLPLIHTKIFGIDPNLPLLIQDEDGLKIRYEWSKVKLFHTSTIFLALNNCGFLNLIALI
uniref:Uncharacterized protein n=1 Tax=Vespula pensylvanica TaxID=30213 RepID=A0A834K0V3_VESPE|nr:hypothetical protein H0235_016673 [Vespula pensylvanica]